MMMPMATPIMMEMELVVLLGPAVMVLLALAVVAFAGMVVAVVVVVVVVVIMAMAIAAEGGVPVLRVAVLDAETPAAQAEEAGRKEGGAYCTNPLGRVGPERRDTRPQIRLAIVSSC
jgi:hypothetical protein